MSEPYAWYLVVGVYAPVVTVASALAVHLKNHPGDTAD